MFNRIKGFFTKSAAETYRTINLSEIIDLGHAVWGQNNYQAFAREGYQKNVIAYHCISQISQALSAIPICAYINEKEIDVSVLYPRVNFSCPANEAIFQSYSKSQNGGISLSRAGC
jgi:hypothetical protein